MPTAAARSGPSGITIMKSSTFINWMAPMSVMMVRSLGGRAAAAGGFLGKRVSGRGHQGSSFYITEIRPRKEGGRAGRLQVGPGNQVLRGSAG